MRDMLSRNQGEIMQTNNQELTINNLHVKVEDKEILKGVYLQIKKGEIHALMGPNGSGKSTLSLALMGHPSYKITKGSVFMEEKNILSLSPDKRAKLGLFLSFQYPSEISGVGLVNFLRTSYNATHPKNKISVSAFMELLYQKMNILKMDKDFVKRDLNVGFSGGEKKRCEMLQMLLLEPKFALLDETDSGLDVDALRDVANGISTLKKEKPGILLITHYQKILHYIKPDKVHVLVKGKIVSTGDYKLAEKIEKSGYKLFENGN